MYSWWFHKRAFLLTLAIILSLASFFGFYFAFWNKKSESTTIDNGNKTILFWNSFYGDPNFGIGHGRFARNCPIYNNCYATSNRSFLSIDDFDAVIFHGINQEIDIKDLPEKRSQKQRYVFVTVESPANRNVARKFDGFFNMTMTHHLDSDVVWNYADYVLKNNDSVIKGPLIGPNKWLEEEKDSEKNILMTENDKEEEKQLGAIVDGKKKIVAWYRSNCWTRSHRENYVEELSRYVKVNKFGLCNSIEHCPENEDCFKTVLEPNYFFHLVFENSLCDDYVTEKLFRTFNYTIVPVVYGGANYTKFAPPHSYVNALDFDSPKELAEHLIELSKDANEYKKFFDWKRKYRVVSTKERVICDLCKLLHVEKRKKIIENITDWFSTINKCPLQIKLHEQKKENKPSFATKKTFSQKKIEVPIPYF